MKRLDLSEVVLALKGSGVNDVRAFRWLEVPEPRALERAEKLLTDLGAIDNTTGAITELGRRMLAFPAHPRYARMLLAAQKYGCVRTVALIAALTQGRDLLTRRQTKSINDSRDELFEAETESDFFVLMRAWRYAERNGYDAERCRPWGIHAQAARQVKPLFDQFLRIAAAEGLDISEKPFSPAAVQRCVLVGFSDHLVKRFDAGSQRCELVHGRRGMLARESVVKAPLFVVAEVREVEEKRQGRALNVMLNLATTVKEEWLHELFPRDFEEVHSVVYDPALRQVVARDEVRFRDLVLAEKLSDRPSAEEAAAILAREVAAGRCVSITGTNRWNSGSCGSIGYANGCPNWRCLLLKRRTG